MRFLSPTPAKIIILLLIAISLLPWYVSNLNTFFNPHNLPVCWDPDELPITNGKHQLPCASPFRAFTYGLPVALVGLIILYVIVSFCVTLISKKKK